MAQFVGRLRVALELELDLRNLDLQGPQLQLRLQPGADALVHQLDDAAALLQRVAQQRALGIEPRQSKVGLRDLRREYDARGLRAGLGGTCAADRGGQRGVVATEQVQRPAALQHRLVDAEHRAAIRAVDVVGAEQFAHRADRSTDRRQQRGVRRGGAGGGLAHARRGGLQVGVAGQRLRLQRVELRVAVTRPPVAARERGRASLQAQRVGLDQGRRRPQRAGAGAAGEQRDGADGGE
ncbi:hypothetical protein GALL_286080 [mine drainage metagenome]|uniref:Uncharacterized protein n=1 Tax=mine drainage metagenome TaxID=410659 RepID=A0A1J5RMZ1_9ZZZZ